VFSDQLVELLEVGEAGFRRHALDAQVRVPEQLFGPAEALEAVPFSRAYPVFLAKESDQMIAGDAAMGGELRQAQQLRRVILHPAMSAHERRMRAGVLGCVFRKLRQCPQQIPKPRGGSQGSRGDAVNKRLHGILEGFETRSQPEPGRDDVATQNSLLMSADTWRQHLKPRLKRVIDGIREVSGSRKVWVHYHSDGDVTPLIDDLIEVGVDILNPVQPECMDLEAVAARYQDRLAFCGMIGTQTTMPFGSPDDVRAAVERCRRLHEKGARVIVAPTHVLEPDVPWENITAFNDAVRARL